MTPLSRLERYGWEQMACERLFLTKGESRVLARLVVDSPGVPVDASVLRGLLNGRQGKLSDLRLLTKPVGRIRAALRDVGIDPVIIAVDGFGYRSNVIGADKTREFVEHDCG